MKISVNVMEMKMTTLPTHDHVRISPVELQSNGNFSRFVKTLATTSVFHSTMHVNRYKHAGKSSQHCETASLRLEISAAKCAFICEHLIHLSTIGCMRVYAGKIICRPVIIEQWQLF
jgi:hypothetical protein